MYIKKLRKFSPELHTARIVNDEERFLHLDQDQFVRQMQASKSKLTFIGADRTKQPKSQHNSPKSLCVNVSQHLEILKKHCCIPCIQLCETMYQLSSQCKDIEVKKIRIIGRSAVLGLFIASQTYLFSSLFQYQVQL